MIQYYWDRQRHAAVPLSSQNRTNLQIIGLGEQLLIRCSQPWFSIGPAGTEMSTTNHQQSGRVIVLAIG